MLHVVWMDSVHAEVYLLHPNGTFEHKHVVRNDQEHHTHSHKDEKHPPEKFFKDLSQVMTGAEEILLTGPGLGKEHFQTYLQKHHANDLGKHIVGMETVDHPTEHQIKAHAVQVFKQRHPHFPMN